MACCQKSLSKKTENRCKNVDLSFFGHDLNVGKMRYIIFIFQDSKKGHVGYVEDYLHMKWVFLNEKKWFVFDTSRYFTFYIIFNLIFDFKKLHKVFLCCFLKRGK